MRRAFRVFNSYFLILNFTVLSTACGSEPATRPLAPADLPPTGPITIALTGDTSFSALAGVSSNALDLVRRSNVGFTNLEVTLLDASRARDANASPAHWIFGSVSESRRLRDLGFTIVSLANNHAVDFGGDGLVSTIRALDEAGIAHAGAGADLAAARTAAFVGRGGRRTAFIALTASASDESRASASQPDIQGRPGVGVLSYDADVTVDEATFQTLAHSALVPPTGQPPDDRELRISGRRIKRGEKTRVDFTLTARDEQEILALIRRTRQQAEFVIVSVHSHEPVNESDLPAEFLRRFAHDAAEAGAHLIVGHGPHRLRGVEVYHGVPIFYSLGNFVYQTGGLDFRAADRFDAGNDLYTAALGASAASASPSGQLDRDWWWQSALVLATLDAGRLSRIRIYPLTLKHLDEAGGTGVPELATAAQAGAILRQISDISRPLGSELEVVPTSEFLDLPLPQNR